MLVHEVFKPVYGGAGGETGVFGYPTMDTHVWRTPDPANSHLVWSLFENGCIASTPAGPAIACGPDDSATIPADKLKQLVRHFSDKAIHRRPDNLGLQPQVDIVAVSDWQHGLDNSGRRIVTYRLYGFKDMGAILPDANFTVLIDIQFDWKPNDLELSDAPTQTLIAKLPQVPGRDNPRIENLTELGIPIAFGSQDFGVGDFVELATIPVDYPGLASHLRFILDMIVSPTGDVQIFTNPFGLLGTGGSFGPFVQQQIDQRMDGLLAS
jgi:hypothetical protein